MGAHFQALNLRNEVISLHATRLEAEVASIAAIARGFGKNSKTEILPRVKTTADLPRPSFADALADRGVVEKKAVRAWNTKRAAELRANKRAFPSQKEFDQMAATLEGRTLTNWYVAAFCQRNSLKHSEVQYG